jgi:dsRNA-specific ribonuclease
MQMSITVSLHVVRPFDSSPSQKSAGNRNRSANCGIDADTAIDLVANAVTNDALGEIASATELERFIHEWNVETVALSDRQVQEVALISVARAVKAVIGAVYEDGGLEGVKKVMEHLGLKVVR